MRRSPLQPPSAAVGIGRGRRLGGRCVDRRLLPRLPAPRRSTAAHRPRGRGISPGTRFFVPPPSAGAPQQIVALLKAHDLKDAALITEMEAITARRLVHQRHSRPGPAAGAA